MSALSLSGIARDFRSALRTLAQARAFAAVAIIGIALGVGLLTTMFALVDAVSLRKLNVANPDSLINFVSLREGREAAIKYSLFERLQANLDVAESVSATSNNAVPITYNGQTFPAFTLSVTGDFYRTMGVRPLQGRTLTTSDDGPVAVISDRFWKRLGGENGIIGKMVVAGSVPLMIVGIVPAAGHESWRFAKAEVVVPFRTGILLQDVPQMDISQQDVYVTARLKSPFSINQIQRKLESLWPQFLADTIPRGQSLQEWTRTAGAGVRVLQGNRGFSWIDASLSRSTGLLFVLAGVVFLTMCSNVAGLFLSRGLGRNREYAVRMVLGATRGDVVRVAIMEGIVLSITALGTAIVLTSWLVRLCTTALGLVDPPGFLGADYGLTVDGRIFAFAMGAAFVTGVAAQIFAALQFSRVDLVESLQSGGKSVTRQHRGRNAILSLQVAVAVVLVCGAFLLVSSFKRLIRDRGGFETDGVQVFTLAGKAPYSAAGPEFHDLLTRVRHLPSVTSVGLADRVPMELDYDMAERITALQGNSNISATSDRGCTWPRFLGLQRNLWVKRAWFGLMEMPRPWKSAKGADFHRRLEKSRQKAARLSHIPTGPADLYLLKNRGNRNASMEGIIAPEKNHVAHPASNPVLDFFAKSYPCGKEGQDAIEDYSESGAKVQVLCVRRRRLAGFQTS